MKVTRNYELVLTVVDDEGETAKIFVPQPPRQSFDSIVKVLQKMYMGAVKGTPPDILVTDYALITQEAANELDDETLINKTHSFIDRALTGATVFTSKGEFIDYPLIEWPDEVKASVEGNLLFCCALCRYVPFSQRPTLLKAITTSLTFSEWRNQCEKSFKGHNTDTEAEDKNS